MSDIDDRIDHAKPAPIEVPYDPDPAGAPTQKSKMPVSRERMDQWRREEPALIRAWQDNSSSEALTVLLKRYNGLIRSQTSKILAGRSVSMSHRADLEQEASLAFIQAVGRFDFNANTPLSALVTKYIRNTLLRYSLDFRNSYRIGTGSDERKAYYAALTRRAQRIHEGESENLTDVDIAAIQKQTGASEKSTKRAVDAIYSNTCSVEAALDVETDTNDQVQSTEDMSILRALKVLEPFVADLDARKAEIFRQFITKGEVDNQELSRAFDLTPERIGQIRREMLCDMADHLAKAGISSADVF